MEERFGFGKISCVWPDPERTYETIFKTDFRITARRYGAKVTNVRVRKKEGYDGTEGIGCNGRNRA